jgi:hypothetical protein
MSFWQQVLAVEPSPRFRGVIEELEHHGKGGLVRQRTFRKDRAMRHGREHAFDRIAPYLGMFARAANRTKMFHVKQFGTMR